MSRRLITAATVATDVLTATFAAPLVAAAGAVHAGGRRTIDGVAVPYGVAGTVADGRRVIFEPGSLDAAARPPVLRDHDRSRPIGRVVDATDTPSELRASVKVSATRDGDEALVLAGDGVLGTFSVGVLPVDATEDDDGTLHVYAGDWVELSLLTIGAFTAARVTSVAAGGQLELIHAAASPEGEPDDDDGEDPVEPSEPVEQVEAARHPAARAVPLAAAGRRPARSAPYAATTLHDVARLVHAARHDDRARRTLSAVLAAQGPGTIEAALTDITLVGTNNVAAMYRPAYQAELVGIISHGTPLIDALRQGDLERGDYPSKTFNQWTLAPTVGLQATEKAAIASTAAKITATSVPVQTWAGGNDISQQTIDLGSPSFVEDYIRAAAMDYAKKVSTYASQTLLAAATDVATLFADTFVTTVAKLFAALDPTKMPLSPLVLAMSWDMNASMVSVTEANGPAFWEGSVGLGSFVPSSTAGGLTFVVDITLPPRTLILGPHDGATWYDLPGTPFNLRAVNVANLGLDVAVYGYGALGVQYPGSFVKTQKPVS